MRSELVFRAAVAVENRYKLCQTTAKAARILHVPNQDMHETINSALGRIGGVLKPLAAVLSSDKP
jgi:hypothetical protein